MALSEFGRVSDLFRGYLAGDIEKSDVRAELGEASEETLEKLSRRFSYHDLKGFFRWRGVLGEFSEYHELRRHFVSNTAVSFYLTCESIYVEKSRLPSRKTRDLYEAGEREVNIHNKLALRTGGYFSNKSGSSRTEDEDPPDDAWHELGPQWDRK